jgi:hypothetical protein
MPICVGTLLRISTFSMPTSSQRPFILLSLNIGRCKLKSFYFCIPCSLSHCITEIIPGHNVCKHSLESSVCTHISIKVKYMRSWYQLRWNKDGPMECCRSPDFGHTSCLKEWLTPELYKFQQNLRFANKGGFGFVLCMAGWWRIMCTAAVAFINDQSCSLPKMNPEQVYCYTFLKTIEVYTDFPSK